MTNSAQGSLLSRPQIRQTAGRSGSIRQNSSCQRTLTTRLLQSLRENRLALRAMVAAFRVLQDVGITVIPNHFYWPVPDLRELETRDWMSNPSPAGLDLNLDKQLEWARRVVPRYQAEWAFPDYATSPTEYHYNNGFFEAVDAEVAYAMVRHFRPSRIIEVGGGSSTRLLSAALQANRADGQIQGELFTIEPFPNRSLEGITNLIAARVQDVDLDLFLSLGEGDILFLDSSHVVSVGSDVVREYLEILPRLQPGVLIHVHDIFLPSDYPRDAVLSKLCFWSEQYLLQAFLAFNPEFEVLWGSSAMQQFHPDVLLEAFPHWEHSYSRIAKNVRQFLPTVDGDRVWPSSFWMRRI
jgi:Methyltransferase domain